MELGARYGSVALFSLRSEKQLLLPEAHRHAELVIPTIATLLQDLPGGLSAIGGIVVSRGPGSFTGLRVAFSTAKALARSAGIPIHTVDNGLARSLSSEKKGAWVVTTLTQDKYLVQKEEEEPRLFSKEEITAFISDISKCFLWDQESELADRKNILVHPATALSLAQAFRKNSGIKSHSTPEEWALAEPEYFGTSRFG